MDQEVESVDLTVLCEQQALIENLWSQLERNQKLIGSLLLSERHQFLFSKLLSDRKDYLMAFEVLHYISESWFQELKTLKDLIEQSWSYSDPYLSSLF